MSSVSWWTDWGGNLTFKTWYSILSFLFSLYNCNLWWRAASLRGQQQQLSLMVLRVEIWQRHILCEGHSYWLSTSGGPCQIREHRHRMTARARCDITSRNHNHMTTFCLTNYFDADIKVFMEDQRFYCIQIYLERVKSAMWILPQEAATSKRISCPKTISVLEVLGVQERTKWPVTFVVLVTWLTVTVCLHLGITMTWLGLGEKRLG